MRKNVTAGSRNRNETVQEQYTAPESSVQMGQDPTEVHSGLRDQIKISNHDYDESTARGTVLSVRQWCISISMKAPKAGCLSMNDGAYRHDASVLLSAAL